VRPHRSPRFDLTPLGHPIWWGALALLVVNDNLLKGKGVVPGWLTGKLSDFAFLIVAPVLVAALLPCALRWRRRLSLAAVVALFVVTDLSPAASEAVVAFVRRLGIPCRLWPDPTDLLALLVLPLTVRVMRSGAPQRSVGGAARRFCERSGVILGAVACVATTAPPRYPHHPFFVNWPPTAADVQITWVLRNVACSTSAAGLAATLDANDLDDPIGLVVGSGQVVALDGPSASGASPLGECSLNIWTSDPPPCVAAIVQAPPASAVLMVAPAAWSETNGEGLGCSPPAPVSTCAPSLDPAVDPGADALSLVSSAAANQFVAGTRLDIAPVDLAAINLRAPAPAGCRPIRAAYDALLSSVTCQIDADCRGVAAMPAPDETVTCTAYVNTGAAPMLAELVAQWDAACLEIGGSCSMIQPAVCRGGSCAAACPGIQVWQCPAACPSYPPGTNVPGASCPPSSYHCSNSSGNICSCVDNLIVCNAPVPISGCSLGCFVPAPLTDAGSDTAPNVDGGSAAD
jgi:hypothetical protein